MATTKSRRMPIATPWGAAHAVEQLTLQQRAGEKRFASLVQLLETDKGERLVRFAYTTDGTTRRGPVTLKLRDLERLRAALAEHPALAEALLGGGCLDGSQGPLAGGLDQRGEDQRAVGGAEQ
jgi:hypothetical protein